MFERKGNIRYLPKQHINSYQHPSRMTELLTIKYYENITIIFLLLVSFFTWADVFDKERALINLESMKTQEYFGPDSYGLYNGVRSHTLKIHLETKYQTAITEFIKHAKSGATERSYQKLVAMRIILFNRDTLDTEDEERVATNFEKIMDAIGLYSSGGALNIWMYGFDPTKANKAL